MKKFYRAFGCPSISRLLVWLVVLLAGLLPTLTLGQTITGTVYKDFNADGVYVAVPASGTYTYGEPGVAGVIVTAYSTSSATAPVSATTTSKGSYTLSVGSSGMYRVEFTNLPTGEYETFRGTNSSTSVQFVTSGSSGVNLGINLPEDYCQSNPKMIIPCYENGSGVSNTNPVLVSLNYTNTGSGLNTYPTNVNADLVGSTWGVAYDKNKKLTYISAFLKRQAGLGDRGLDGIYVVDNSTATATLVGGFDLEGVTPSNGGSPLSFGSVTRTLLASGSGTSANDLSADRTQASRDENAFAKVGKVGYGDIDIDQTSKTLWAVNLNERSLVAIDISSNLQASAVPNALASAKVKRYFIDGTTTPSITGLPGCPSGTMRPFGLKIHNGVGYLGVVCDGSALTSPDMTANQQAYVLSFNPTNPTAFTQVTSVPLNYAREQGWVPFSPGPTFDALESDKWQRWVDTYTDPTSFGSTAVSTNVDFKTGINGTFVGAPQPILADIEFLPNGDMVLGFMDRFAHQQGWANYIPGSSTILRSAVSQGDVLLASFTGSGYVFEGPNENDNFTTPPVAANAQSGQLLTDGPSGAGEFFYQDYYIGSDATHPETALGGLAVLPGSNELTAISFDPAAFNAMGIRWLNSSTGYQSRTYTIVSGTNIANFGKGSALGDVELLCNQAPIQIGNRVWVDSDNDGVQDPGEPVLAGVVVQLTGPGVPANTTVVTNSNGEYYFSNAIAANTTGFVYSLTGLTSGSSYSLTFPTSASAGALQLSSKSNTATGTNADNIDTDPTAAGVISFTLGDAGENNFSYDAAYVAPASLGDYVFIDANKDGIQNTGDTPLAGVKVTLYLNGTAVATTTTNATGLYSFTGLTPSTSASYSVGFTTPTGYTATSSNVGSDTADSDPNPATGITAPVTLTAGENNTTIDAGFYLLPASLGDYVFLDANKDGVQNTGDTPLAGVKVTLYLNGSAVATTTTNAAGLYSFTGLTPGTSNSYVVGFTAPAGYTATISNVGSDTADSDADLVTGRTQSVTLAPGENNPTLDAGFYQPTAGLGNYVFDDKNANGIQDTGDLPIPGVRVTLYASGTTVGTTLTDANGLYSFTGLTPGTSYTVGFGQPVGYLPTLANIGDDALDSDASPLTGLTGPYSLTADEFNSTVDAGFYLPTASLGNFVFEDVNKDGLQDAGDLPIQGAVVTLLQSGTVAGTTTTNASGIYSFTGLTPGIPYSVSFTTPVGFSAATTSNVGTNDAIDSDPVGGITDPVTLSAGENNTTLDAGFVRAAVPVLASLGDFVFEDVNKDGLQDAGDLPISGAVVTLLQSGTVAGTTTTNASGLYSFTGLTPGIPYSVSFTTPVGFSVATTSNAGSNDAIDSDPVGGVTAPVTLTAGENNPTLDAGFVRPAPTPGVTFALVKTVNNKRVEKGGIVTYTISVTNTSVTSASNVVITDTFSTSGLTIVGSATSSSGTFTPSITGGSWTIPTLAASQTATISFQAQVNEEGLAYNVATAPDGTTATACLTVPFHVCANEAFEFELSAPASFSTYQWSLNGTPIPGATSAILSITAIGEYTVATTNAAGCPDGSCCPFVVVSDPAPSLTATAVAATCTGSTPNNDAKITLVGSSTNAVSYNITLGSSFTASAPLFASNQPLAGIAVGGVLKAGLANPLSAPGTTYTIRVYSAEGCYRDMIVVVPPAQCQCPPAKCAPFVVKKVSRR